MCVLFIYWYELGKYVFLMLNFNMVLFGVVFVQMLTISDRGGPF